MTKFKKDLGVSLSSSILSFLISLGLSPIMTRLYTPEDYGIFSLINTISIFIATFALLSIQSAFSIENSFLKKVKLLATLINLSLVTFISTLILIISFIFFIPEITWHYILIPIVVLGIMLQRVYFSLSVSHKKFTNIAKARVIHPFFAKISSIIASLLSGSNALFLILFESIGYFLQAFILFKNKENNDIRRYISRIINLKEYIKIIITYKSFASYNHFSTLLFIGFLMMQTLIISINYTEYETGIFSLANSMSILPVQLLSMAMASVIYQKMIEKKNNNEDFFKFNIIILGIFFILGLIPYITIYFFGEYLFSIVFGENWSLSGKIASILCISLFFYFIYTPLDSVFKVLNKLRIKFIIDFIFIVPIMIAFYIYSSENTFIDSINILVILIAIYYFILILTTLIISKRYMNENTN